MTSMSATYCNKFKVFRRIGCTLGQFREPLSFFIVSAVIYIHCWDKSPSEFRANSRVQHSVARRNPIPVVERADKVPGKTRGEIPRSIEDAALTSVSRVGKLVPDNDSSSKRAGRPMSSPLPVARVCGKKPEISNRQSGPPFNVSLLLTSSLSQGASLRVPGRPNLGNYHRVGTQQRRTFTSVLEREVATTVCAQQRKERGRKRGGRRGEEKEEEMEKEEKEEEEEEEKKPLFV